MKRPAAGLAAAALAVMLAHGPLGVTGGAVGGPAGSASVESALGQAMRSKLVKSKRSARRGHQGTTWKRLGLKRKQRRVERGLPCAANSYGQVQRSFLRTPCRALDRMLVRLGDGNGTEIVVSVAWVEMRSTVAALRLRELADTHGTGNVSPLPGAVVGSEPIRWTGHNYDSRRARRTVVIAEVEPLRGSPTREYMDGIADVAVAFPRP